MISICTGDVYDCNSTDHRGKLHLQLKFCNYSVVPKQQTKIKQIQRQKTCMLTFQNILQSSIFLNKTYQCLSTYVLTYPIGNKGK